METEQAGHKRKGFASMTPEQRRSIAQLGGMAAHATGRAHVWTSEEAVLAGRKGGKRSKRPKRQRQEA